jgi:uncharacterized membrane protein
MSKSRVEAFSDGVLAIIITIMVLELQAPEEATWESLRPLLPTFLAYLLSFVYVAIYWNNHHHLFQAVKYCTGGVLWANVHLLFWLSLIPFTSAWMGATWPEPLPVAIYGVVLTMAAVAWTILANVLIRNHGPDSVLARTSGPDAKGYISLAACALSIPFAFVNPVVSALLLILVALLWLIPSRRIERLVQGA